MSRVFGVNHFSAMHKISFWSLVVDLGVSVIIRAFKMESVHRHSDFAHSDLEPGYWFYFIGPNTSDISPVYGTIPQTPLGDDQKTDSRHLCFHCFCIL